MADFGGFGAIIKEAQSLEQENQRKEMEPVACPKCGALLQVNRAGVRNCPMGHWRQ